MKKYYSVQEVKDKITELLDNLERAFTSGQIVSYDFEDFEERLSNQKLL